MKNKYIGLLALILLVFAIPRSILAQGDVVELSDGYEWPKEQAVLDKLSQWQDLKFGVILHWGLYSVPGIVESWSICDENWITRDTTKTYQEYTDWYNGQRVRVYLAQQVMHSAKESRNRENV